MTDGDPDDFQAPRRVSIDTSNPVLVKRQLAGPICERIQLDAMHISFKISLSLYLQISAFKGYSRVGRVFSYIIFGTFL